MKTIRNDLSIYDKPLLKLPVYIPPAGGVRPGAGRKPGWNRTSYPLKHLHLPHKLASVLVKARNKNVDEETMVEAIKELI